MLHSKSSGMDHTVLPANNTLPAFPSWAFTRCHHHINWGSGHPIATHYSYINPERMKGWVGLVNTVISDRFAGIPCCNLNVPPRPTQPGHPSVGSRSEYRHSFWPLLRKSPPLPSIRHHRRCGDCLGGKGGNYQVCSVQYCVQQLCTVRCTHIWTD